MTKNKPVKIFIFILLPVVIILCLASVFSYNYFGVLNPFASGIGLIKVNLTGETFAEVQKSPRIIIFKPGYDVVKVMEEHGYIFHKDEQMGAGMVFEKDGKIYRGVMNGGRISFWRCYN